MEEQIGLLRRRDLLKLFGTEGKIKIFAILMSNYSLFSRAGYYQGRFRGSYFKLFVANFFFSLQFI